MLVNPPYLLCLHQGHHGMFVADIHDGDPFLSPGNCPAILKGAQDSGGACIHHPCPRHLFTDGRHPVKVLRGGVIEEAFKAVA